MRRAGWIGVCLVLVLASCTRDQALYDPCPPCPSNISFKGAIIPVFKANCAIAGCHDAITHAFNVNLDSAAAYATVTEPGTGFVYNNTANQSIIYNILISTGTSRMPPAGYGAISPCDIQEIGCWIDQGAQNN